MSIPPDLRVLCRKLTTATPTDLPALCPILVNHVLRCGGPLSTSAEQHSKSQTNEAAGLVHKLKTQVNTLLRGKSAHGRFAGMVLAKAMVDVGGWECLRTSEPWVAGILSILQKPDPFASKEICVAVLVRIYSLLQQYPTLVREIATPTIPSFAKACLQLLKPAAAAPLRLVESIFRALAALIPLYPTTLRPFAVQLRQALRVYLAPTATVVPSSLCQSARRLLVLLPYTAPKNGHADEWAKLLDSCLRDAHATADQIFRAVRESADPRAYRPQATVSDDGEPQGGVDGDGPDGLPAWTGLSSGAERLIGLLDTLATFFSSPTKSPVAVPLAHVAGLVSRLSLVLPSDKDSSSLINPSIAREERDELWSALPAIHAAALALLQSVVQRMGAHIVPLAPEMLEDAVRMFAAARHVPRVRQATYGLVQALLPRIGDALERPTVDALGIVVRVCCQDVLGPEVAPAPATAPNGMAAANTQSKNKPTTTNADLFLNAATAVGRTQLDAAHAQASKDLLTVLLAYLPQQHVKKADRALMDRTAILVAHKEAMLASVLHPYVDRSGRYFANTIPFLARAYPHDLDVEILRSNLRTTPHHIGSIFAAAEGHMEGREDDEDDEEEEVPPTEDVVMHDDAPKTLTSGFQAVVETPSGFGLPTALPVAESAESSAESSAAAAPAPPVSEPLTLKRKTDLDESLVIAPKRPDIKQTTVVAEEEDGSDSDGSVQLDMVFDDVDDSEDEKELD